MIFDYVKNKKTIFSPPKTLGNLASPSVSSNDLKKKREESDSRRDKNIYTYGADEFPSSPSELPQNKNFKIPYTNEERIQSRLGLSNSRGNIKSDGIEESQYQALGSKNHLSIHLRENSYARGRGQFEGLENQNVSYSSLNPKVNQSFYRIRGSSEKKIFRNQETRSTAGLSQSPELHKQNLFQQYERETYKHSQFIQDRDQFWPHRRNTKIEIKINKPISSNFYNVSTNSESKNLKKENEKLINYIKKLEEDLNKYQTLYEKCKKSERQRHDLYIHKQDTHDNLNQNNEKDHNLLVNEKINKRLKDENYKLKSIIEGSLHKKNKEIEELINKNSNLKWNSSDLEAKNKRAIENIENLEKNILEVSDMAYSIYSTFAPSTNSSPQKFSPESSSPPRNYYTPQKSSLHNPYQRSYSPSKNDLKCMLEVVKKKTCQILEENEELKYIISRLEDKVLESECKEKEHLKNIKDSIMENRNFYEDVKIKEIELEAQKKKIWENEIIIANFIKKDREIENAYETTKIELEKANINVKNSDKELKMIKDQISKLKSENEDLKKRLEQEVKNYSISERPITNQGQLEINNLEKKLSSINDEFDRFREKSQIKFNEKEDEFNQYREQVENTIKAKEDEFKSSEREWDFKEKHYQNAIKGLQKEVNSRNSKIFELEKEKEDLDLYSKELEEKLQIQKNKNANQIHDQESLIKNQSFEVNSLKASILNLEAKIIDLSSQKDSLISILYQHEQTLIKKEEENKAQIELINKQKEHISNLKNKENAYLHEKNLDGEKIHIDEIEIIKKNYEKELQETKSDYNKKLENLLQTYEENLISEKKTLNINHENEMKKLKDFYTSEINLLDVKAAQNMQSEIEFIKKADNSKIEDLTLKFQNCDKKCIKLSLINKEIYMHYSNILSDVKDTIKELKFQFADELKTQNEFIEKATEDFKNKVSPIIFDYHKTIDDLVNKISFLEQEIKCKNEIEAGIIEKKNTLESLCEIKDKEIENLRSSISHVQKVTSYSPVLDKDNEEQKMEVNLEKMLRENIEMLNNENLLLKEELKIIKSSLQMDENNNKKLSGDLDKTQNLKSEYQIKCQDLEKASENIKNLTAQNEDLNKKIQENNELIEKTNKSISLYENREKENSEMVGNKIKILSEKIICKDEEIKRLEQTIDDLKRQESNEINKHLSEISKLKTDIKDANISINELKAKLFEEENKLTRIMQNIENDKGDLKSRNDIITKKDEEIKYLTNICYEFENKKEEFELILEGLKKDVGNKNDEIKSLQLESDKQQKENQNLSIQCNTLESELKSIQNAKQNMQNDLENFKKENLRHEAEKKIFQQEIFNLQQLNFKEKSEIEKIQSINSEKEKALKALENLQQENDILSIQFNRIKNESEDKSKSLQNLQQEINLLKKQSSEIEKELNDKSEALKGLQQENGFLKNSLQGIEKEIKEKSKNLQDLQQENDFLKNSSQGIEKEIKEKLKALQDLQQENGFLKNTLQRIENEIKEKSKALHDLQKENDFLKYSLQGTEKEIKEKSKILHDLQQENGLIKNNLQRIEKEFEGKSKALDAYKEENTKIRSQITEYYNSCNNLSQELTISRDYATNISSENERLKKQLVSLQNNPKTLESPGQPHPEIIMQMEMEISNLKNNIKLIQENNSKMANQNRELNDKLLKAQKEFKDIKLQLSSELALQQDENKRLRDQIAPNLVQIFEPLNYQLEDLKKENIHLSQELNKKTLDLERINSESQEFKNIKLDELIEYSNKLTKENKDLKNLVRSLKNS